MSTSMFINGTFTRLQVESRDNVLWVRAYTHRGLQTEIVAITLTSKDKAAMLAALESIDTSSTDSDAEIEVAA